MDSILRVVPAQPKARERLSGPRYGSISFTPEHRAELMGTGSAFEGELAHMANGH